MITDTKDADGVMEKIAEDGILYIDFRFTDLIGRWCHISYSTACVSVDMLKSGIYFDASSVSGWKGVEKSDMILLPDCTTALTDMFSAQSCLIIICDVINPANGELYSKSPRSVIKKAQQYLKSTGMADVFYTGTEPEFFVFDSISFHTGKGRAGYEISSDEFNGVKSDGKDETFFPYLPKKDRAYLLPCPADSLFDLRSEMASSLADMGVKVEKHHHEVARCQHEIVPVFENFVNQADTLQILKYVVCSVACSYNKVATFMPKPLASENGSGLHINCSLWKNGKSLFTGNSYGGLSDIAMYFIGGILQHARALNAFTNPTVNSYRRLVKGFEAPVLLTYSACNRSAACRIPLTMNSQQKRVEIRFPDPSANPYLAFSALLMAGIDGIEKKISPAAPIEDNLFELDKSKTESVPSLCCSLSEALTELNNDRSFLMKGDVFSADMIDAYISVKNQEIEEYNTAINPIDFKMYF
jgi:glutamine synthetase